MSPDKPCELEIAGVDPDGFHEDPDAPVPGADTDLVDQLLAGGPGRVDELVEEAVPEDRPSGVYKRVPKAPRAPKAPRLDLRAVSRPGVGWVVQGPDGEALDPEVRSVGCFLLRPAGFKRCRVFNRLTGFEHVTYGSDEEIDVEYARQSDIWAAKLSVEKSHGSGWRGQHFQKQQKHAETEG